MNGRTLHSILKHAGAVESYPYPHIVIKNALDFYDELSATRPSLATISNGCEYGENERIDFAAVTALKADLPPVWREFLEYHSSPLFWRDIVNVFGEYITTMYPSISPYGPPSDPERQKKVTMRCAIGANTPTTTAGSVRGPHIDSTNELVAGLFYMPLPEDDAGGDLEVHELLAFPQFRPPSELLPNLSRRVKTVPYAPNTFFMFVNGPYSIHAVTPRQPTKLERRLVSFAVDCDRPIFDIYGPPELINAPR